MFLLLITELVLILNNVDLGNGLSNIEKRISEINGKVKIVSKKNMGTEIQIICNL